MSFGRPRSEPAPSPPSLRGLQRDWSISLSFITSPLVLLNFLISLTRRVKASRMLGVEPQGRGSNMNEFSRFGFGRRAPLHSIKSRIGVATMLATIWNTGAFCQASSPSKDVGYQAEHNLPANMWLMPNGRYVLHIPSKNKWLMAPTLDGPWTEMRRGDSANDPNTYVWRPIPGDEQPGLLTKNKALWRSWHPGQ